MQALQVSGCGKRTPNPPYPTPSRLRASGCRRFWRNQGTSEPRPGDGGKEKDGCGGGWRDLELRAYWGSDRIFRGEGTSRGEPNS